MSLFVRCSLGKRKEGVSSQPSWSYSLSILVPFALNASPFTSLWPPFTTSRYCFTFVGASDSSLFAAPDGLTTLHLLSLSSIYSLLFFSPVYILQTYFLLIIIGLTLACFSYCRWWSRSNLLSPNDPFK